MTDPIVPRYATMTDGCEAQAQPFRCPMERMPRTVIRWSLFVGALAAGMGIAGFLAAVEALERMGWWP